ncbi:MAG: acyl-CoA reductase, partial [Cyclobacteriaceae bacterium]
VDAVICTGSDNTARYFEYYFGKYPNVIRKNRTSIAILDGTESDDELAELANDIFSYYGLGCRNVSKIFTPKGYDLTKLFPHFEGHKDIIHHNKYCNNYEYHKAIFLVNQDPHLDTGFLLIRSVDDLVSPISVLFHQEYESREILNSVLESQKEKIQCIVSKQDIPFGQAQSPQPWDYADGVDTLQFLANLKESK